MRLRALAFVAFVLVTSLASADRGGYTIAQFDVDLTVEPGSDLVVQERLVVDFSEPRHGIYRTIPVSYTDPRGYLYGLGFRLLGVEDAAGRSHERVVTREGSYVKIRIGDPDVTVQGRVVYVIRYRVTGAVAHFPEHDELYWNATGNEWQSSIGAATTRVHLPGPVAREDLEAVAYTGAFGSREQEAVVEVVSDTEIAYTSAQPLGPLHGLTVVAAWPHGLVSFPGPLARAGRFVAANWVILFPLLAAALLFWRYWTGGRDPRGPETVMVRYEPPAELAPGEIGALVDERVDLRDLTATLVDLSIRGYLRIEVERSDRLFGLLSESETSFVRTKSTWGELKDYEQKVLEGIFASGASVSSEDLEEKFYSRIPGIKDSLWDDLTARRFMVGNPRRVKRLWASLGVVAGGITAVVGYAWAAIRGAAFPHAMIVPLASAAVVCLLFLMTARAMPRRTKKGVELRAWALGFEEFVDRVERHNLEEDEKRGVFEALLPYAMALGVAATWAKRFEGIYSKKPPLWFHGTGEPTGFTTRSFERTLSSAMSRAATGMTTAPRSSGSSGSGGGGFSGGGGGGGGGGSW